MCSGAEVDWIFQGFLSKCTCLSETSRLVHFKLSQLTAEILETEHNPEGFSLKGRRQGQGDNQGCWGGAEGATLWTHGLPGASPILRQMPTGVKVALTLKPWHSACFVANRK